MQLSSASPPADFKYKQAFLSGRPKHAAFDAFSLKHPSMEFGRRAKIFAPFDALQGFSDAVSAKETVFEPFREIDEERQKMLNRRILLLRSLAAGSRLSGENRVRIEVTYFSPCADPDSSGDGAVLGRYCTRTGLLRKIDLVGWQLLLDDMRIDLDDVYDIQDPEGRLFAREDSEADWFG